MDAAGTIIGIIACASAIIALIFYADFVRRNLPDALDYRRDQFSDAEGLDPTPKLGGEGAAWRRVQSRTGDRPSHGHHDGGL